MKKIFLLLGLTIALTTSYSQTVLDVLKKVINNEPKNEQPKTLKTVTIISTTKKLNGTARAALGGAFGAASRIEIPVTIPENTVDWYYSFSTASGSSGNFANALKLAVQIGTIVSNISSGGIAAVVTSGLSQSAIQSLEVPSGSMPINAYLLDATNVAAFTSKMQFSYIEDASSLRATQSLVRIDKSLNRRRYYIGLDNISNTSAVNIQLEVVAIVAE